MADTLHGQMTADLRYQISSGALAPGSTLPSEAQLAERYGVSRITVRRALQTLEQEGLVRAQPGRGPVVRDRRIAAYRPQDEYAPRTSGTMDRFTSAFSRDGRAPSQSIDVAIEPASGIIAQRLRVAEGTPVVARKRVRYLGGEPFNINDSYYPLHLVEGTAVMEPRDIPEGSAAIVEQLLGPETHAVDEIYIRMPNPTEARRLELPIGTPVAVHYCTGLTVADEVVRVEYFVLPGDRHVIMYERDHPDGGDEPISANRP